MSSSAVPVILAKPNKPPSANGMTSPVLKSSSAAAAQQSSPQKPSSAKTQGPRLKVVVRRLPPDVTEGELVDALGPEWIPGNGRVDWISFKPGKASQECVHLSSLSFFLSLLLSRALCPFYPAFYYKPALLYGAESNVCF